MPKVEKLKKILKKAFAVNSQPTEESFPELPQVLVWMRFALGAAYGFYLGTRDVRSGIMPLQALNLIAFVPVMYCRFFLGASSETFASQVVFSGLFNALALCILIWVYYFTLHHEEETAVLSRFLIVPSDSDSDPVLTEVGEAAKASISEEPEF